MAAGANHYVATFDETIVLKLPVVPREERMKYLGSYAWTDVSYVLPLLDSTNDTTIAFGGVSSREAANHFQR